MIHACVGTNDDSGYNEHMVEPQLQGVRQTQTLPCRSAANGFCNRSATTRHTERDARALARGGDARSVDCTRVLCRVHRRELCFRDTEYVEHVEERRVIK